MAKLKKLKKGDRIAILSPFTPTRNSATIRAQWDKEVANAKKNSRRYTTAKEALADL